MSTILAFPTTSTSSPRPHAVETVRRSARHLVRVRIAAVGRDLIMLRGLFAEQRHWLTTIGVAAEEFDDETAAEYSDPAAYYAARGVLLFATRGHVGVGIAALRDLGGGDVELRRMYVSPWARGSGAGTALLDSAIEIASRGGYRRIVLESIPGAMDSAIRMYRDRGFAEIVPFSAEQSSVVAMELNVAVAS
jgi:GNAT superfamily N-acetyltransferase